MGRNARLDDFLNQFIALWTINGTSRYRGSLFHSTRGWAIQPGEICVASQEHPLGQGFLSELARQLHSEFSVSGGERGRHNVVSHFKGLLKLPLRWSRF